MARVNIEDHAFGDPRLERLAREIRRRGYDTDELSRLAALGLLATVWHESQAELMATATPEQIDTWAGLEGAADLLLVAKYLRASDKTGALHITGNEHQIAGLVARKIKGREAAKKRWAKVAADARSMGDPSSPMGVDAQDQDQGQGQNKRENAPEPSAQPMPRASTSAAWEAYRDAFVTRYGAEPVRNATVNGQLANLVGRLGDEAPAVLRHYVRDCETRSYLEARHPVRLALRDAEGLAVDMRTRGAKRERIRSLYV